MGANDQETTVRITGEDNTGKAVTSIGARFYALDKQVQAMFRGYSDGALVSTKAIDAFAKKNKVSFDQAFAQMEKMRNERIKADNARAQAAEAADKANNKQKAGAKDIAGGLLAWQRAICRSLLPSTSCGVRSSASLTSTRRCG